MYYVLEHILQQHKAEMRQKAFWASAVDLWYIIFELLKFNYKSMPHN